MKPGDLLVPIETPYGPRGAREAWAEELHQLAVVTAVSVDGRTVTINVPSQAQTVTRPVAEILGSYEPSNPEDPFGRSWGAAVTRAATEAARVDPAAFNGAGAPRYWERVVAVVARVLHEEQR